MMSAAKVAAAAAAVLSGFGANTRGNKNASRISYAIRHIYCVVDEL